MGAAVLRGRLWQQQAWAVLQHRLGVLAACIVAAATAAAAAATAWVPACVQGQ